MATIIKGKYEAKLEFPNALLSAMKTLQNINTPIQEIYLI